MKIENNDIKINFFDDILASMTREQKIELGQMLCMEEDVLDYLVEQLAEAYASPTMDSFIHRARTKLEDKMPQVAAELVRALNTEVQRSQKMTEFYREGLWNLERRWPVAIHCQKSGCDGVYRFQPLDRRDYPIVKTPSSDKIMKSCGFEPAKQTDHGTEGWDV